MSPEFDISFEPDDLHEESEVLVQVQAATWGLTRIGANQRGRAYAGATFFVLDTGVRLTHREISGRASPSLNMTDGDPRECGSESLYVGEGGAPPTPPRLPTPAPLPSVCSSATSTGPDSDGDCRCDSGLHCYEIGSSGCTFSYTATCSLRSTRWFLPSCSNCQCK